MAGLMNMKRKPDDDDEEEVEAEPMEADTEEEEGEAAARPPMANGNPDEGEGEPEPEGDVGAGDVDDQTAYEKFVKNGAKLIYNKETVPQMLESLEGDGNPVEGLANTLAMVVSRLIDSAEQGNAPLPDDVILHGAGELLNALADFSEQSGGHKYSDDEKLQVAKALLKVTSAEPAGPAGQKPPPGPPQGGPPGPPNGPPPRRGLMGG